MVGIGISHGSVKQGLQCTMDRSVSERNRAGIRIGQGSVIQGSESCMDRSSSQ